MWLRRKAFECGCFVELLHVHGVPERDRESFAKMLPRVLHSCTVCPACLFMQQLEDAVTSASKTLSPGFLEAAVAGLGPCAVFSFGSLGERRFEGRGAGGGEVDLPAIAA